MPTKVLVLGLFRKRAVQKLKPGLWVSFLMKRIVLLFLLMIGLLLIPLNSLRAQQTESKPEQKETEGTTSNGPVVHEVSIFHVFVPQVLVINVGDSVRWVNKHGIEHSAKSLAKNKEGLSVFFTGQLMPPNSYVFQFNEPGTYDYVCGLHPAMTGTIIVKPKP